LSTDRDEQFKIFKENVAIYLKILKPVVAALPSDLSIVIHLCKGNGSSHFQIPYTYHDFLPLFAELKPQPKYLLLEWDDERSGSLEVLKEYNNALPNTLLLLGFVTTKNAIVESEEYVMFEVLIMYYKFVKW
jgi:methionine synthase II (cobalamin-independent)